jgi:hypothetical protein
MRLIVLAAALAALSGCASFQGSTTEKLVVQAATMKFCEANTGNCDRIEKVAAQARVWLDTDGVTIGDLRSAMLERVNSSDLLPSDKLLATALVDVVAAEIDVRIGAGVLDPEKKATVNTVLGWVEQAAAFY